MVAIAGIAVEVGELVGRGRTSDVYAYGRDSVIKVPHASVAADWPRFEAELTQAVWTAGIAAPEVREVVVVDGRDAVVFERIAGPSMWQLMLDRPGDTRTLACELAGIQQSLQSVGVLAEIPEFVDRLVRRIRAAPSLSDEERIEAVSLVGGLPRGAALLHGDLHPGNVLMGTDGPVVIDWFDAAIGHPVADIIRSSILMQSGATPAPHLPGGSRAVLDEIRTAYLAVFRPELDMVRGDLASWQGVIAAGRLAEDAELDEGGLLALWSARHDQRGAARLLVVR